MRAALALLLVGGIFAACEPSEWRPPSTRDSHEDPAQLRPGYGNETLHAWWPLTDAEIATLGGADKARAADAHALLAFAIMGSGVVRDAAGYARITQRFDAFLDRERAAIEAAPDDKTRGDILNRAMHAFFFTGTKNEKYPDVGAYELDQARLTGIFDSGHYNCISSALLYTTLARAYSLPVRGVMTKQHAFVELDPAGIDQRFDVETTTEDGFGKVHDAKFYEDDVKWQKAHGFDDPMTYADYESREILPPYVFVARAMNDKRVMNDDTEGRLVEAAATLAPDDHELVSNRLAVYGNEANALYDKKAWRTMLRFVQIVAPTVSDAATRFSTDKKVMNGVGWLVWANAEALLVTGRGDEAVSMTDDALDHLDPAWKDATRLKENFTGVLLDRMTELETSGDYEKSVDVIRKHIDACHANDACLNNLYLTFDAWCVKEQVAKDWHAAKKVMQVCISLLPDDTRCHHTLAGLDDQHPG